MAQKHRTSNAQDLRKSDLTTRQLYRELKKNTKMAIQRMANLRKAGLQQSEFYQEHKGEFRMASVTKYSIMKDRKAIAEDLARVNQFLNARSSTVRGNIRARKNLVDLLTKNPEGPQFQGITMENIDRFSAFMKEWRNHHMQNVPASDVAVDLFLAKERMKLSEKDLWENVNEYMYHMEEIQKMSVEDIFPGGSVPKGQEFTLDDYLGRY